MNVKIRRTDADQKLSRSIGKEIKALRLEQGISILKLAELVDVTSGQIRKYELGQYSFSVGRLFLIAKALKTNLNHFYQLWLEKANPALNTLKTPEVLEISEQSVNQCVEVTKNFMKLSNPKHQQAINLLIKSLSKLE